MTRSLLVAYGSRKGSTQEVAAAIAARLEELGHAAELRPAARVESLAGFDGVVLGGALYVGRWHADASRFVRRHRAELAGLPVAVFALGPRTVEEHDLADSMSQLDNALAALDGFTPLSVAVFGGVVDPAKLRFPLNRMPASDARDWDAIRAWADEVAGLVAGVPA